jgi:hypothetical protein
LCTNTDSASLTQRNQTPESVRKMDSKAEERFLAELRHHLQGWKDKILEDFSEASFSEELASLKKDPIYTKFHLDTAEYVLIRLMGRVSISIGRRLGEIYDKLPRFIAQAKFNLTKEQVAPKLEGKFQLDICIPWAHVTPQEKVSAKETLQRYKISENKSNGLGIEIRYNFNPNDSARLRKDVDMARLIKLEGYVPIYLIFTENSPRDEAIARLKRAGWNFVIGEKALGFISEIIGADINSVIDKPRISKEVHLEMKEIMKSLYSSYAVERTKS